MKVITTICLLGMSLLNAQEFTRGLGIYPGEPKEDFGPTLRTDANAYRNLALHRPAYQSSSYDYNLTSQLITDGIKDTTLPMWVSTSSSVQGVFKKNERERLLDHNWVTSVDFTGAGGWVQIQIGGGAAVPEITRIDMVARVRTRGEEPATTTISGSDDGQKWTELAKVASTGKIPLDFKPSIPLNAPARNRYYRVEFSSPSATYWQIGDINFFSGDHRVEFGGPYHFTSAWMSGSDSDQWVYVDLGAPCTFDKVALYWIRKPAEGYVQVSDDGSKWQTIQPLPPGDSLTDEMKLAKQTRGRYVRVMMTRAATPEGFILSEMEVYGRGGPIVIPKPAPATQADGQLKLAGGSWRIQRDSLAKGDGGAISSAGYKDADWLIATVPGTILGSYLNAGAIPDPNFGDNQLVISDSFFYADFWYRTEFTAPALQSGRRMWLNLDGINWKADVFLNGEKIGRIDGGFMRGKFDVTEKIHGGQRNSLAIRVEKNATPGSVKEKTYQNPDKNGGALGADNPTYHASIGWDWIPTIRGRNTGVWGDVYLTTTGPVTIENPFVQTKLPLPDTSSADVSIQVSLRNTTNAPISGTLKGRFGDVAFETPVSIDASATNVVKLDPTSQPALHLQNPKLWWPVDYGDPNLYRVELRFEADGAVSDSKSFQAGVRQFTYSEDGGALKLWINGRRFIARGGNWGFSESMLRYRTREYEAAVRYHRDMHLNMIRNWVGQIGDDAFWEACDRNGVVVWQDFWLANPYDGPDPDDNALFMADAKDYVERIRNHASIGLYCGRNEGYPPKPLEEGLRALLAAEHPDLHYISSSADDVVSGHGPYQAMPTKYYYEQRATTKLHSELGMPNIVTMDSLRLMMPEDAMWPQGRMWGLHDFSLTGAQGGKSFLERIEKSYGNAANAAEWVTLAQFVNYEGYRAMYEAQSKNRMGLLIWMSHPCWPSQVWQTYDYYFDPTAAYFGVKKASEPLHIQWNPVTDNVEVVNYSAGNQTGLSAKAQIINTNGSIAWEKTATLDSNEDSTNTPIHLEYPAGLTPVHFVRLQLSRGAQVVSDNIYWRGTEEGNYQALRELPKVKLSGVTRVRRDGSRWVLSTELRNTSNAPAVMVHLKAIRDKSKDRILPAIYDDNYVTLMPGEHRTINTEILQADTRGEKPAIVLEGFNFGGLSEK